MNTYFVFKLSTTCLIILGTIIFAGVCFKRRDLFSWLFAFITASIAEFFRLISQDNYDIYYLTGLGFSTLTLLLIIIAVSHEYYKTFLRPIKTEGLSLFIFSLIQLILSISLQILIGILLFIALFLILRIYLNKKTPTHAFLCFILIGGIGNLIAATFRDLGIDGAEEFFHFSSAVMATNMFLTGIVALIEERLVKSEKKYRLAYDRAEFYKDLFVHDINNILQNLEFSLEIMSQNCKEYMIEEDLMELLSLAKKQVNRGAELGINVRKLSDLELGKIDNIPIPLNDMLINAIEFVKPRFPEKKINIIFDLKDKTYTVFASEFLYDTFRIILNNAIRYNNSPEVEVVVKISLVKEEGLNYVRIEFIDNGVGMPDKMKDYVFYKVHERPRSFKRIGLGLLLVGEIVHGFNGKVWAEDKVKGDYTKGTKIVVLIPEAQRA
ncbi:MAG: sensor histidine kinase [Candidatus Hermodarchaeota archaeon]